MIHLSYLEQEAKAESFELLRSFFDRWSDQLNQDNPDYSRDRAVDDVSELLRPIADRLDGEVRQVLPDVQRDLRLCVGLAVAYQRLRALWPVAFLGGVLTPIGAFRMEKDSMALEASDLETDLSDDGNSRLRLGFMEPAKAFRTILQPLSAFLGVRLASRRSGHWSGSVGLVTQDISCNSTGYTVITCPYYLTGENYFGSPSTPVSGSILPGAYRLGVKKRVANWDTTTSYTIPNGSTIHLNKP